MKKSSMICLLIAGIWLARLVTLGSYDLMDSTEGRYAEIARMMVSSGDWITPRLAPDEPFWGKPPLSFWAAALVYSVLGVSAFASRLPAWVFCTLILALTFVAGRRLMDVFFGLLCVLVLASTASFFVLAGGVMTDPALAFCVTLSGVSILMAGTSSSVAARWWWYVCCVGIGLSMLAKGPVGVVLTAVPLALAVVLHVRAGNRLRMPLAGGLLTACLIAIPWYVLAEWQTPGFLKYFFFGEHIQRFLTPQWSGDLYGHPHLQPRGMIWAFLTISLLPWSGVVAAVLVYRRTHVRDMLREAPCWFWVALVWGLAPALVFTFARNIMWPYVLPGLPGMAIAITYILRRLWLVRRGAASAETAPVQRLQRLAICVPLLFVCIAVPALRIIDGNRSQKELVAFFLQSASGSKSSLIYVREDVPYSARFYSSGRALAASCAHRRDFLSAHIADKDRDYYAVKKNNFARLPSDFRMALVPVSSFGEYVLYADTAAAVKT